MLSPAQKLDLLVAIGRLPQTAKGDQAPVLATQLGWSVGDVRQRLMTVRMVGLVALGGWRLSPSARHMVDEFEKSKSAQVAVMASADGLAASAELVGYAAAAVPVGGRATAPTGTRYLPQNNLDRFAELISEGLEPTQAGLRMGFGQLYGNATMQRLRKIMGAQAV